VRLEELSLSDLYLGWTVLLSILFGGIALFRAPNDLASIFEHVGAAAGVASVVAAYFSTMMWIVIEVAR
jgi:hypothetical protein